MAENYTLQIEGDKLAFKAREMDLPGWILQNRAPAAGEEGIRIVTRMGDPDLIQCIVYKKKESGAIFVLRDPDGALITAVAENNLSYALALDFFGNMVANARYGVDIFESMELPDD